MYLNRDGWPVVAPHRYVPYTFVDYRPLPYAIGGFPYFKIRCSHKAGCWNYQTIRPAEVSGQFKYINHGKAISAAIIESRLITLGPDGSISGAVSGNWSMAGGNHIEVEIDEAGEFSGVLSRGWNEGSGQFVITFSAQSAEGISIWGSKLAE